MCFRSTQMTQQIDIFFSFFKNTSLCLLLNNVVLNQWYIFFTCVFTSLSWIEAWKLKLGTILDSHSVSRLHCYLSSLWCFKHELILSFCLIKQRFMDFHSAVVYQRGYRAGATNADVSIVIFIRGGCVYFLSNQACLVQQRRRRGARHGWLRSGGWGSRTDGDKKRQRWANCCWRLHGRNTNDLFLSAQ